MAGSPFANWLLETALDRASGSAKNIKGIHVPKEFCAAMKTIAGKMPLEDTGEKGGKNIPYFNVYKNRNGSVTNNYRQRRATKEIYFQSDFLRR